MKKSIIAGAGVAALSFAALPFAGVFAATGPTEFTDTLNVEVVGGCTLENSTQTAAGVYTQNDRTFNANINAGTVGYLNADANGNVIAEPTEGKITVSCNTSDSSRNWTVSVDVTDLSDGATPTAHTITGGDDVSGNTSAWAIQSNATNITGDNNPFATYAPAADGSFLTAAANQSSTFNPSYRVYVSPTQASGSYTGSAKYTINLAQ